MVSGCIHCGFETESPHKLQVHMLISHGMGEKPKKIVDINPDGLEKWLD